MFNESDEPGSAESATLAQIANSTLKGKKINTTFGVGINDGSGDNQNYLLVATPVFSTESGVLNEISGFLPGVPLAVTPVSCGSFCEPAEVFASSPPHAASEIHIAAVHTAAAARVRTVTMEEEVECIAITVSSRHDLCAPPCRGSAPDRLCRMGHVMTDQEAQEQPLTAKGTPGKKPEISFKTPLSVENNATGILQEGDGETLKNGDRLCMQLTQYSLKTGEEVATTWDTNVPDCSLVFKPTRRAWIMRGVVTPIFGLLAVACIVFGVLNSTVWKPSRNITATAQAHSTQYVVIDPGVLDLVDTAVTVSADNGGTALSNGAESGTDASEDSQNQQTSQDQQAQTEPQVCMAVGSAKDVSGWLAGEPYVRVTGLSTWQARPTSSRPRRCAPPSHRRRCGSRVRPRCCVRRGRPRWARPAAARTRLRRRRHGGRGGPSPSSPTSSGAANSPVRTNPRARRTSDET